jgi:DeoR family fructose operon transcriptional repressor
MSRNLIPAQRRREIEDYLRAHQIARSSDLCELLDASEATIRRDLEALEEDGILERTHGGAVLTQRLPTEPAYASSALAHPDEKRWIGREAAARVNDGDTVFLNSGTTTAQIAAHLSQRSDLKNVTVITNSLSATLEISGSGIEVLLLGGAFRPLANSTFGPFVTVQLRQVSADMAFIGVDGMTLKYGCTTPASPEAEIAQMMIERTRGLVLAAADHSKWGVVSNFEIARWDQIYGLICDQGLALEARAALQARSLHVWIAGPEPIAGAGGGKDSLAERSNVAVR